MGPSLLFSPSQLAYLHTSLSLQPPIRPDARGPTTFRSLRAETDLLPAANGSARVCFAEGGEAVVGVRAEVEHTVARRRAEVEHTVARRRAEVEHTVARRRDVMVETGGGDDDDDDGEGEGEDSWVEVVIEQREDDAEGVVLAEILREALLADGDLRNRLVIGSRWHWRLLVDIVLLSPPSTYPLPLLSLTTHLALLSCRLPALTSSSRDDDPIFNDDWDAALPLYPFIPVSSSTSSQPQNQQRRSKPPVTLLVISVGDNIFFDPSSEELAVADAVVAISVGQSSTLDPTEKQSRLKLLALRTIDPPSRQFAAATATEGGGTNKEGEGDGVWRKRMGGMKRGLVGRMIKMVLEGGVGAEIFHGLDNWT